MDDKKIKKRISPKAANDLSKCFIVPGILLILFSILQDVGTMRLILFAVGTILDVAAFVIKVLPRCPYCNESLQGHQPGECCPTCGREIL